MTTTNDFVEALSTLRPGSTFLTLKGYRNSSSEVADISLCFHISYKSALERSIEKLNTLATQTDLEKQAKAELLESFRTSLAKTDDPVEQDDHTYRTFTDPDGIPVKGIKMHKETGEIYLWGLVSQKRVLMPGMYPTKNRKPLTIVKDKMRALCPVGRFRQFKINPSQVDSIRVEGLELLPPEE